MQVKTGVSVFAVALCLVCVYPCSGQGTPAEGRAGKSPNTQAPAKDPSLFDRNLLVNGGAEAEMKGKAVRGWGDPQEGFSTPAYGSVGGEWDWDLSGCSTCQKQYFHLVWDAAQGERSFSQAVNVAREAALIDEGKVAVTLSGYFGAYRESDTTDHLVATFQDEGGKALGSLETAFVDTKALPAAEKGSTSLMFLDAHGSLPKGTRKVEVKLAAKSTGDSGSYLAVADNLSLVLTLPKKE